MTGKLKMQKNRENEEKYSFYNRIDTTCDYLL